MQVFDSWASVLPDEEFEKWCLEPMVRICEALRQSHPDTPIIGFPRAVGPLYKPYLEKTGVNAIGCDTSLSLSYIRDELQPHAVVQGNLDPMLLLHGGPQFENRVKKIIETLAGGRHIFNLGHGIIKETPFKNVERLVELVRGSATLIRFWFSDLQNRRLQMDSYLWLKALARDFYHCLDGWPVLSASSVCLSLPGKIWIRILRNAQGDGAPTAQSHHEPGDDCQLDFWFDYCRQTSCIFGALVSREAFNGHRPDSFPHHAGQMAQGF